PVLGVEHRGVVERARSLIEEAELFVDLEALLVVDDGRFEVAIILVGLRHACVQRTDGGAVAELCRQLDRPLIGRERLLRLPEIGESDREVNQPAEVEWRIRKGPVFTSNDTLT